MTLIVLFAGLGMLCVVLWYCAVYAVPAFVGFSAGWWALNHGAGLGCVVIGLMAGVAILLLGRIAITSGNSWLRWTTLAVFTIPATYAGYSAMLDISGSAVASATWRSLLAGIGALIVGATTFARLTTHE